MQHRWKHPVGSVRSDNCSWPWLQRKCTSWALSCVPAWLLLIYFLAVRAQLRALGDILQPAAVSCCQEVFLRFGLHLLFSLCHIHIDILSPIHNHNRRIWPSHSLTALIIWLFCCSAFVHFCQYILHNEVLRSEDSVLHVLMWELHTENSDSLLIPGNSTEMKKMGWGKVTGWLESLSLDTRRESKEGCDGCLLLAEIFKSCSPLR